MSVMKTPVNGPERAITLFRDVDFCYASGLSFRVVYLIPVKHQNDVGIRLDFPRSFFRSEFIGRLLGLDSTPRESWLRAISGKTAGFCQAFKSL
ncbi:Uncharacterised protein [Escherichia coli]|nr:Uncharacterised protein [Escherichia coli]